MDYIDIPDLQRRGILKKKFEQVKPSVQTENGYVNLSSSSNSNTNSPASSPFDFLDSLASSASEQSPNIEKYSSSSTNELQDLKVQLENFEYKLDRLVDKLMLI